MYLIKLLGARVSPKYCTAGKNLDGYGPLKPPHGPPMGSVGKL